MIDYSKKITLDREKNPLEDINFSIESDRGRIISAPSIRRLQKRTQVFALELNAAVRSRLTHSLEVAQVSRYIAKNIIKNCKDYDFCKNGLENAFISIAEMASLLHDVGNPPFGHFGELAINQWVKDNKESIFSKNLSDNKNLKDKLFLDLSNFDGNAQAIRIVHKLQRLNLSYSQIASIMKYTREANEDKPTKSDKYGYLKKKPGYYYSEKEFIEKICEKLSIKPYCRFPITYIMEAADDISYLIADIEDAIDKRLFDFSQFYDMVVCETKEVNDDSRELIKIVCENYNRYKKDIDDPYMFDIAFTIIRARIIGYLSKYAAEVYCENHESIFDGRLNSSLLEFKEDSESSSMVKILRNIAKKHIFINRDVEELEIKGYKIIYGLLDTYKPILSLSNEEMISLLNGEKIDKLESKLFRRLPKKHIYTYKNKAFDEDVCQIEEKYYRCRLLIDYISGMTDDFALNEYQSLNF